MVKPKISIILPVYNVEKYLCNCMDSLVNQTFQDIEIIAVNDGSTDSSLKILSQYASKDKRVKIINQENRGLSSARNSGIGSAAGDYIMLLDSDDWIDLETCEVAFQVCMENQADIVFWSYIREFENLSLPKVIFNEDRIFDKRQCRLLHCRFAGLLGNELSNPENSDSMATAWGKLYKREIINNHNLTFMDLKKIGAYEDGLFNLYYFGYIEKAVYINRYFNHYRKSNSNALTQTYKPELFKQYKQLFHIIKRYINENGLSSEFNDALNNRICLSIIGVGLTECLKENPKSSFEKIRFIREVINDMMYKNAYKQLTLKYFPVHWKLFFGCAKYNNPIGVYLLLLVMRKIINR